MKPLILLMALSMPCAFAQGFGAGRNQIVPANGQRQQATGDSSIAGNVLNDVTHEPVRKARVTLNGPVGLTAVTDEAGHFAFKELPPGTYFLNASEATFAPQRQRPGSLSRSNITVATGDQKSGVKLTVIPGAAISGRITDEEGGPIANCSVTAMQLEFNQGSKTLGIRNGASSNEKGEYRMASLPPGNYFLFVRCHQAIPLPHAFIRRSSGLEAPTMSYAPLFYPGTVDFNAASKVTAAAGTELSGMDFRLSPGGTVSVRGKLVIPDPEAKANFLQVQLKPRDSVRRDWINIGARTNQQSREFRFDGVTPGSYDIVANTIGENQLYSAKVPIEIGTAPPEPVEVMLNPAVTLTGTVAVEGDEKMPLEAMRIQLIPVENDFRGAPPPNSAVQRDGTFTLKNVSQGRWNLLVQGPHGYVKSITISNRETASPVFDIAAGGGGPVKVILSTVFAKVDGTVTGLSGNPGQFTGVIWPVQEQAIYANVIQNFMVGPEGRFSVGNLAPGQYVACAIATLEAWQLVQNPAVKSALKSRCETVEVSAAGANNVQLRLIPAQDFETIAAASEN